MLETSCAVRYNFTFVPEFSVHLFNIYKTDLIEKRQRPLIRTLTAEHICISRCINALFRENTLCLYTLLFLQYQYLLKASVKEGKVVLNISVLFKGQEKDMRITNQFRGKNVISLFAFDTHQ